MKITFDAAGNAKGVVTVVLEETDYKKQFNKELEAYRKKVSMPGFRPGMVPMGLVKKQAGTPIKVEAVNKVLSDALMGYVESEKIEMVGAPLPTADHEPQDLEADGPYTFKFDIAFIPKFDIDITPDDEVPVYEITPRDNETDQYIDELRNRFSQYKDADSYQKGDFLKGDVMQLTPDGEVMDGGVQKADTMLVVDYFKDEDQAKLFEGVKKGDVVTFNPHKAFGGSEFEIKTLLGVDKDKVPFMTGDFRFLATGITRREKAELNQEFFDNVFGMGGVKTEEEFRARVEKSIAEALQEMSNDRFKHDLKAACLEKVGDLGFDKDTMVRIMKQTDKELTDEKVEEYYQGSIDMLVWGKVKAILAGKHGIKVDGEDIKKAGIQAAKQTYARYGMDNVPEEMLESFHKEQSKKDDYVRALVEGALETKVAEAALGIVKVKKTSITRDDFMNLK